ncbi:GTPase Der [bacterium HR17]|jgi:GTP-binding protein|uniref:GTPase Der n=1 Tax=Candidatus Fervidibacter japonicus TaxID=2035412 RepID=A0A2H5XBV8_9BACT|nr:GTPase Der [bacterium HR17]
MPKPVVAIVGKPNVGKSALFNRLVGKRIAIVDETPGVTRDRIAAEVELSGRRVILFDTGGIDPSLEDTLMARVVDQVRIALAQADVIVFLVDGREGPSRTDGEIAEMLRKSGKPIVFAANKVDEPHTPVADFWELRLGEPIPISALHGRNVDRLKAAIVAALPPPPPDETLPPEWTDAVKVAIVGRPNVGKSALLNALLGEERVIVSPIPGTTRDAIDTPFEWRGHKFILIDTAGIRRKAQIKAPLEYYAVVRAFGAIDRCDVAVLVIDGMEGVTRQDARIGGYAHEQGKPTVLVVNKWDVVREKLDEQSATPAQLRRREKLLQKDFAEFLRGELWFLSYAPVIYTSATQGWNVTEVLEKVLWCYQQSRRRITTGVLNRTLRQVIGEHPPPSVKGRQVKVYYAAQVEVTPPTFALFVNDPALMPEHYLRFLEQRLRTIFDWHGTPMRWVVRPSHERKP